MRSAPLLLGVGALALSACSGSSSSNNDDDGGFFPAATLSVALQATAVEPVGAAGSSETFIAHLLRESVEAADLNGDGDQLDDVVHVFDNATGTNTNLGFATTSELFFGEGYVSFLRDEASEVLDLNGDGDQVDSVLSVHDFLSGITRNTGFAAGAVHAIGKRTFFEVPEAENGGIDLNGNLAADDNLFYEHDSSNGLTVDTGFLYPGDEFSRRGDTVVFASPDDLIVYDILTGFAQGFSIIAHDLSGSGDCLAFSVYESEEMADLNTDGDQDDSIVFIYDFPTSFLRNTKIPRDDSVGFGFSSDYVAFQGFRGAELGLVLVDIINTNAEFVPVLFDEIWGIGPDFLVTEDEAALTADRNGDGDTNDTALTFVDSGNLVATPLSLAVSDVLVRGNMAMLAVDEAAQGATDLNGDGEATGSILHRFQLATEAVENTMLDSGILGVLANRFMLLNVAESTRALNNDGDVDDAVLHVLDLQRDRIQNLRLAVQPGASLSAAEFEEVFPALIPEADQGRDLNADGDSLDHILHLVENTL